MKRHLIYIMLSTCMIYNVHSAPIHDAVREQDQEKIRNILQEDPAQVYATRGQEASTPLHIAASLKAKAIVNLLLQHGAPVNAQKTSGNTPLHSAVRIPVIRTIDENELVQEMEDIVDILCIYQADPNIVGYEDQYPLHILLATTFGRLHRHWDTVQSKVVNIMRMLLACGAHPNVRDIHGGTPLHYAIVYMPDPEPFVRGLLERGANANLKEDIFHLTPLHSAARAGLLPVVSTLLEYNARVNRKDTNGDTPLHLAAQEGHYIIVRTLLEHKAHIQISNNHDETPIDVASTQEIHNLLNNTMQTRQRIG